MAVVRTPFRPVGQRAYPERVAVVALNNRGIAAKLTELVVFL